MDEALQDRESTAWLCFVLKSTSPLFQWPCGHLIVAFVLVLNCQSVGLLQGKGAERSALLAYKVILNGQQHYERTYTMAKELWGWINVCEIMTQRNVLSKLLGRQSMTQNMYPLMSFATNNLCLNHKGTNVKPRCWMTVVCQGNRELYVMCNISRHNDCK